MIFIRCVCYRPFGVVQTFGENEAFRVKSIKDDDDGEHTKYGNNSKGYTPYYPMYNFSYNG